MRNLVTPEFRMSYPNLTKPRMNKLSKKLEYSVAALFKKGEDLSALKAAVLEACEEKWGKDKTKWPQNLRTPFRDQADRAKPNEKGERVLPEGYVAGAIYLNLKNERKPGVVDANVQPILDENEIYGGCYARASVQVYAYDFGGNTGVNFSLQNVQKTRDGDPFSHRVRAEDEFMPVGQVQNGEARAASTSIFD